MLNYSKKNIYIIIFFHLKKMMNYSMNSPGIFNGCHFQFVDKGAFRCKQAYIKIFSINNEQLVLTEITSSTGFNYSKFIPKDFCAGGIEVGYDIAWGESWPIRHKFIHGSPYKSEIIDLNSLYIQIYGTTFHPHIIIRDGSGHVFKDDP